MLSHAPYPVNENLAMGIRSFGIDELVCLGIVR